MKKKLIAVLIVLTLALCFGGCGKEETSETQGSEEGQEAAEEIPEAGEAEAEPEEAEEEISYISCTADEMMQECVDNLDSAKEKYLNQYVEITGVLDEIELDENASPVGRVVRLDTSVDVVNAACKITGITWDEKELPLEEFERAMEEMQPGDTVTMKVYVDDLDNSFYDYYFTIYGVEKQ